MAWMATYLKKIFFIYPDSDVELSPASVIFSFFIVNYWPTSAQLFRTAAFG